MPCHSVIPAKREGRGTLAAASEKVYTDPMEEPRQLDFIMIKPSHYDDDGYPITWWRALIPSNSLAALNGIAADCAERQVLGPDIALNLIALDETNRHIVPSRIVRDLRRR